jgi:hypothetical protein
MRMIRIFEPFHAETNCKEKDVTSEVQPNVSSSQMCEKGYSVSMDTSRGLNKKDSDGKE